MVNYVLSLTGCQTRPSLLLRAKRRRTVATQRHKPRRIGSSWDWISRRVGGLELVFSGGPWSVLPAQLELISHPLSNLPTRPPWLTPTCGQSLNIADYCVCKFICFCDSSSMQKTLWLLLMQCVATCINSISLTTSLLIQYIFSFKWVISHNLMYVRLSGRDIDLGWSP